MPTAPTLLKSRNLWTGYGLSSLNGQVSLWCSTGRTFSKCFLWNMAEMCPPGCQKAADACYQRAWRRMGETADHWLLGPGCTADAWCKRSFQSCSFWALRKPLDTGRAGSWRTCRSNRQEPGSNTCFLLQCLSSALSTGQVLTLCHLAKETFLDRT